MDRDAVNSRIGWARAALHRQGFAGIRLPGKVRMGAWSMLARFQTDQGAVWLKYVRGAYRQEPALTAFVHRLAPDLVPELLASDDALACWLVRDVGARFAMHMAQARGPALMAMIDHHAALQAATLECGDELRRLGAKDLRPQNYPRYLDDLLHAEEVLAQDGVGAETVAALARAMDPLRRVAMALVALNPPQTLVHMDLRLTNLKQGAHGLRIIDWGDGGVGPAFLDPVPLYSELDLGGVASEPLKARQVSHWQSGGDPRDLARAQSLCRIVFPLLYAHGLVHSRPSREETLRAGFSGYLRGYLDIFLRRLTTYY